MNELTREERLQADFEKLQSMAAASSIFSFEPSGEPPDRYKVSFRGKGLGRDAASQSDVTLIDLHEIDLRMPYSYPTNGPDIRWSTPLMHPNVSFSGFVNLSDIGIVWRKDVPIEMVVERLWDVARGAYMNTDKATNYSAKNWLEKENQYDLPVDRRPLLDKGGSAGTNIVRYERRAGQGVQLSGPSRPGEVVFIDENTPTPSLPQRQPIPRRRRNDDDVIYIGPE